MISGDGLLERSNLTASQLMMWTGQQLQPNDPLYNMVLTFEIDGPLDPGVFSAAFERLVEEHDALRTVIVEREGVPNQRVLDSIETPLDHVDFSAVRDPRSSYRAWARERSRNPFTLSERLVDSALVKLGPTIWVWFLNQHHLVTDAWAMSVLYRRMAELYLLTRDGNSVQDSHATPQFADYVVHERELRSTRRYERARAYWRSHSRSQRKAPPLGFYRRPSPVSSGYTERVTARLGPERTTRLRMLAASAGFRALSVDLACMNLFATALGAYLYRIAQVEDCTIGTPSHNRSSRDFRCTAGAFIDMLPLRFEVPQQGSFADLHEVVAARSRELLLNAIPGACDIDSARSFSVVLNYITAKFGDFAGMPARSEWIHAGAGDRNHVLRLQIHDFDQPSGRDDVVLHFDANVDAFSTYDREALPRHFLRLLDGFLEDPEQRIDLVPLIEPDEADRLHLALAGKTREMPGACVLEDFERQVATAPQAVAARLGAASLSYAELDGAANRVAEQLQEAGVAPGMRAAILLTRSFDALAAVLGCMKRRVAFVPVDISYPAARIRRILDVSRPAIVLTKEGLTTGGLEGLLEGAITVDATERADTAVVQPSLGGSATAYILHTSGSTGAPKGVVVSHEALANYVSWAVRTYVDARNAERARTSGGEPCAMPLFTSLGFDLTLTSIFVPLCSGGTVVIYEDTPGVRSVPLQRVVEDNRVSIVKLTPSHLLMMQAMQLDGSRIHTLIVGGEDLKVDLARNICRRLGGAVLFNEYGPTEATVGCTFHRFDPEGDRAASVPIGLPIDNAEVYLVDRAGHMVPRGVVGEIHIGGAGVAEGYFGADDATSAAFLPNPWRPGEHRYATGDLGRLGDDGSLEYLGRRDQQVKIRGVRVETGEIEVALTAHDGIDDAVVLAVRRGELEARFCVRCGLDARHPDAHLDESGICSLCRDFETEKTAAMAYFRPFSELEALAREARATQAGTHDSIMLLSGGKDSSYALCRAVEAGFKPLVFTLDNGYLSEEAMGNVRRIVDLLGLDLEVGRTDAMNRIFVDSLQRYSNVCNGCFKTIYTLSTNLAHERGIRFILTGLSRGQIFETRLAEFFKRKIFDPDEIDRNIIEARKIYHRMEDAVRAELDTRIFETDAIFDEVRFVDFYRYCDSTLDEVYKYLASRAPWIRPSDTGRSTNCLINEAGIHVHKTERGFHNYALPYSWDVRLGHKERDAARLELDDDINTRSVVRILGEIGYARELATTDPWQLRLVAYYAATEPLPDSELREAVARFLPVECVPQHFIHVEEMPVTANGKIDRSALPDVDEVLGHRATASYEPPTTPIERSLAQIWEEVLGVERVGVRDDFFDLGGDSILNIQIVAAARGAGLLLSPEEVFEHTTIATLANAVGQSQAEPARGPVSGPLPLLPIQRRFLQECWAEPGAFCQLVSLRATEPIDLARFEKALERVLRHHDGLRAFFERDVHGDWSQIIRPPEEACVSVRALVTGDAGAEAGAGIDFDTGVLVSAVIASDAHASTVTIAIHHLVVDAVSWWILLGDLEACYLHEGDPDEAPLPPRTMALPEWTGLLERWRRTNSARDEARYWRRQIRRWDRQSLASVNGAQGAGRGWGAVTTISRRLTVSDSEALLGAMRAQRVQVPELLLAGLVRALAGVIGGSGRLLRIDLEGHGRETLLPEADLVRTIGWFTSLYPTALVLSDEGDPLKTLRSVRDTLRGIPSHGAGYGVLRHFAGPDASSELRLDEPPVAELLFNYLGHWDNTLSSNGLLSLTRPMEVRTGAGGRRPYAIELNAVVFRGVLQVDWTVSRDSYDPASIERLADTHIDALLELVREATARPADDPVAKFPEAGLSEAELSSLLDELGDGLG